MGREKIDSDFEIDSDSQFDSGYVYRLTQTPPQHIHVSFHITPRIFDRPGHRPLAVMSGRQVMWIYFPS